MCLEKNQNLIIHISPSTQKVMNRGEGVSGLLPENHGHGFLESSHRSLHKAWHHRQKPNITGRKVEEAEPKPKPNRMPTTSSRAMKMEMKKVRTAVTPAIIKGAIITIPSGMFCRAIPKDTPTPLLPLPNRHSLQQPCLPGSLCRLSPSRKASHD